MKKKTLTQHAVAERTKVTNQTPSCYRAQFHFPLPSNRKEAILTPVNREKRNPSCNYLATDNTKKKKKKKNGAERTVIRSILTAHKKEKKNGIVIIHGVARKRKSTSSRRQITSNPPPPAAPRDRLGKT